MSQHTRPPLAAVRTHFTTPKGTELPLLDLKKKEYLQVQWRLVWFREEHPTWTIDTKILTVNETVALARAEIRDETGRIIGTGHKTETPTGFPDYVEKAETGAIGRALAIIGFGTQFASDDLDEGHRIVDAPATPPGPKAAAPAAQSGVVPGDKAGPTPTPEKDRNPEKDRMCGQAELDELRRVAEANGWDMPAVNQAMWKICGQERLGVVPLSRFTELVKYIKTYARQPREGLADLAATGDIEQMPLGDQPPQQESFR